MTWMRLNPQCALWRSLDTMMVDTPETIALSIANAISKPVRSVQQITGSFDFVFRAFCLDGSSFIVKFSRNADEDFITGEACIHRYLWNAGTAVPALIATHDDLPISSAQGIRPYIVMEDIKGSSLHEYLAQHPGESARIFSTVGSTLYHIHQLNPCHTPTQFTAQEALAGRRSNFEACQQMASDFGWSESPVVECLRLQQQQLSVPLMQFVHHDMHARQLLLTDTMHCSVIDWSDAGAGEAADDLGPLIARGLNKGWPIVWITQLLDGYYGEKAGERDLRRLVLNRAAFNLIYFGLFQWRDGKAQQAIRAKEYAFTLLGQYGDRLC